jgi:hypothetical protein
MDTSSMLFAINNFSAAWEVLSTASVWQAGSDEEEEEDKCCSDKGATFMSLGEGEVAENILGAINHHLEEVSEHVQIKVDASSCVAQVDEVYDMLQNCCLKQEFSAPIFASQSTYSAVTKSLQRASNGGSQKNLDEAKSMLTSKYQDLCLRLEPQGSFGTSTILECTARIKSMNGGGSDKARVAFEKLMRGHAQTFAMVHTKLQLEISDCEDKAMSKSKLQLLQEKTDDFHAGLCEIKANLANIGL